MSVAPPAPFLRVVLLTVLSLGTLCAEEPLQHRVKEFRVKNCLFSQCYEALTRIGIRLCVERTPNSGEIQDVWIDNDGYYAFTGPVCTLDARDVSRETLLNRFVKVWPDYRWEAIPNTNLVNLLPNVNSVLDRPVSSFKGKGEIYVINDSVEATVKTGLIRGSGLPEVTLDFPGGTQRDLLNALAAAAGDNFVWRVDWLPIGLPVVTWSAPRPDVDRVRLAYEVQRGIPIDQSADLLRTNYQTKQVQIGDEIVMVPNRDVLDLAFYHAPIQNSQYRDHTHEFYGAIRALLKHDVDKFMEFCSTDSVRNANQQLTIEETRATIINYIQAHAADTYRLVDVIDPKTLKVFEEGKQLRYEIPISVPLQSKYGEKFSFTLAKSADGTWRIVAFDLSG